MKYYDNFKLRLYRWLKKGELYLKLDTVYLAKGGFWLTLGQSLSAGLSFILAICLGYFVPPEVYGNYKYVISLWGIITAFSLTGLGTAIIQAVSNGFDGTLTKGFFLSLKWSIFSILISIGLSIYYFLNENNLLGVSLLLVALTSPFIKGFELYNAYLRGKKDFKRSSLFSSAADVGTSLLLIASAYFFSNQTFALVFSFFFGYLVINAFLFAKVKKEIPQTAEAEYTNLNFGKHLSLMGVMSNLSAQLDKVLIFHFLGAAQVAVYTFATAIPKQIRGLLSISSVLATPKYATKKPEEIKTSVKKNFISSLAILIPIIILYILMAPFIYKIFFPKYLNAVVYSQVYVVFLLIMGNMSSLGLTALKAVRQNYALHALSSVINIALMLLSIKPLGIWGIVISTLSTKFFTSILSYVFLKQVVAGSVLNAKSASHEEKRS